VSGKRKKHTNGFPFRKLHETKHSLTFLSVDFPATEDGHTLVIPKKHFEQLEDTPKNILADLMAEVKLVTKILRKNNKGTNICLTMGNLQGNG
jgi:histidine triad (HIT) family protein